MGSLKRAASRQAADADSDAPSNRLGSLKKRRPDRDQRWEFSFRFFRQIKFFGLSGVEQLWLVSLIERLGQLGQMTIDECISDPAKAQAYRLHPIDWKKKNVPIERKDLDWIERTYLDNEESYPMRQFALSKSMGRVVGFFDENHIFQIVLLDPLHNIQPSKDFAYAVDPCDPMDCELTQLKAAVEAVINATPVCECELSGRVSAALNRKTRDHLPTILLTPVDDATLKDLGAAMDLVDQSYSEIFAAGIAAVLI